MTRVFVRSSRYGDGGCQATRIEADGGCCFPCQQAHAPGGPGGGSRRWAWPPAESRCGAFCAEVGVLFAEKRRRGFTGGVDIR